jgi:beta-galactosidase
MKLFSGQLVVLVQSTTSVGELELEVSGKHLKKAVVKMYAK